jgi:antitoxin component of MazEF toxin-antitoxin module
MFVHNKNMIRKLVKTGNSVALILSKDMREHLGLENEIDVELIAGEIRLRRPMSFEEAKNHTFTRYSDAYKKLAE